MNLDSTVIVCEPIAILRRGIVDEFSANGYQAIEVDDLSAVYDLDARVIITCAGDREIEHIAELSQQSECRHVIALRDQASSLTPAAFVAAGAATVLPRGSSPELCVLAVAALQYGCSVTLLSDASAGLPRLRPGLLAEISVEERSWLEELADGQTVSQVAVQHGYSERELHRRLARLYGVLGVGCRVEAVVLAARLGLITTRVPRTADSSETQPTLAAVRNGSAPRRRRSAGAA